MQRYHQLCREWSALLHRMVRRWEPTPIQLMLLYFVFGLSALYVSDVYLVQTLSEPLLSQIQTVKGFVEVVFTGILIFMLTAWSRAPLKRTTDTLERQREQLNVLHRVLRHNFRNDLNVLYGFVETRDPELTERHREQARQKLEDIVHNIEQANRIRRITEQNGTTYTFDFPALAEELVDGNPHLTDSVDIDLRVDDQVSVVANHMFPEAINELLTNAVVHAEKDAPNLQVTVTDEKSPIGYVTVSVSDDGPGLPDRVMQVLDTTHIDQLTHLEGMGLWFVLWTVSNSEGSLDIDATQTGTTVQISVPKAFHLTDDGTRTESATGG